MSDSLGVIIGRFQVTRPHAGHRELMEHVAARHATVMVILGDTRGLPSMKNPMPSSVREPMIRREWPDVLIRTVYDHPSDEAWSADVDQRIGTEPATIYGSRDSFLPHYRGRHPTCYVDTAPSREGGAAHLVNFLGTDTMAALTVAHDYYDEPMAGFSIPAAEHSTITSWGKEREADAYRNMLEQFPAGLVAVVSDSYDIYRACRELWGHQLRAEVCDRAGTLVVRPDSGHPPEVVCRVLRALADAFSYRMNSKGFKVLDDHVRVIQGDGIDAAMLGEVLDAMTEDGWSADNIAFGSGGGLLQKVNRDTCRFAFKCSAIRIGEEWRDVYKQPVTDPSKNSKAGRFDLPVVFENGRIVSRQTFARIRALAQ